MTENGILQQIQLLQYEMGTNLHMLGTARVGIWITQGEVVLIMIKPHIILLPVLQKHIYINIEH